jgi:hypothetical protein
MPPDLSTAEQLAEIEAIKQLKARYFRLMDTKDWEGFARVFATDVEVDVSEDASVEGKGLSGREAVVGFIRRAVGEARTIHHGHMPEIELLARDRARGVWAMFDWVEFSTPKGARGIRGYGHYHETYEKREGAWVITTLRLTRLRVDPIR